ncbi:hypothetical protein [Psychromonas ossibalaenae]|uniref:hypothetical protein n=1 Tax=Psychromonas ossibalaenae TaxID=444922 RepID=UPI00035FEF9F|nr:hypothetical protein [Psychromonas ossibalaenae]
MKNNNKKGNKQCLVNTAKAELQKTQALSVSEFVTDKLLMMKNDKLKNSIVLRDKILDKMEAPSKNLLDRIESEQSLVEEIQAEVDSLDTTLYLSLDQVNRAILALRIVDPKLASELQNAIALKHKTKKNRTITKKRL